MEYRIYPYGFYGYPIPFSMESIFTDMDSMLSFFFRHNGKQKKIKIWKSHKTRYKFMWYYSVANSVMSVFNCGK